MFGQDFLVECTSLASTHRTDFRLFLQHHYRHLRDHGLICLLSVFVLVAVIQNVHIGFLCADIPHLVSDRHGQQGPAVQSQGGGEICSSYGGYTVFVSPSPILSLLTQRQAYDSLHTGSSFLSHYSLMEIASKVVAVLSIFDTCKYLITGSMTHVIRRHVCQCYLVF